MSGEENAEKTRQFFEALDRGEIRDDLIHPDFEISNVDTFVFGGVYGGGPEGFKAWYADFVDALRDPRWELQVVTPVADDVLIARHRLTAHTHTAAMDLDMVWWSVCRFRDGQVFQVLGARTKAEALAIADAG